MTLTNEITANNVDDYIKNMTMENYVGCDKTDDFQEDIDTIIQDKFNNYDDNWNDYGKPSLDEFIMVQHACYDYLEGCDCLELITEKKRDWKWWFNIYALSMEWQGGSICGFKDDCFEYEYEDAIINFQSNIRRRQATIRTIKKLHLTGTL
tara:strand:+ start:51 stop:503 length:453 start_codon:yes stop_codon:yes gene_type:complete